MSNVAPPSSQGNSCTDIPTINSTETVPRPRDYTWIDLKPARDLQELTNTFRQDGSRSLTGDSTSCSATAFLANQNCPCIIHKCDNNPLTGQSQHQVPVSAIIKPNPQGRPRQAQARGIKRVGDPQALASSSLTGSQAKVRPDFDACSGQLRSDEVISTTSQPHNNQTDAKANSIEVRSEGKSQKEEDSEEEEDEEELCIDYGPVLAQILNEKKLVSTR